MMLSNRMDVGRSPFHRSTSIQMSVVKFKRCPSPAIFDVRLTKRIENGGENGRTLKRTLARSRSSNLEVSQRTATPTLSQGLSPSDHGHPLLAETLRGPTCKNGENHLVRGFDPALNPSNPASIRRCASTMPTADAVSLGRSLWALGRLRLRHESLLQVPESARMAILVPQRKGFWYRTA